MKAILPVVTCLLLAAHGWAQTTISPAHPELLQQGILAAYASGQKSVVIPSGTYLIPSAGSVHLDLENLNNFEIDATGATFVFQDVTAAGIYFYNCKGVYFHGATLYYGTPPFSQGTVQAVASDASSFDIQTEPGYPTDLDNPTHFSASLTGHIFDSTTRLWKPNIAGDFYGSSTVRLGPSSFRIFTSSFGGSAGDLVGIRPGAGGHMIEVNSSSLMQLSDLTILNSPLFGIAELFSGALGANTYTNITITRGNRPAGATTDPLFSTSADGFHSVSAHAGPYVTNCSFQYMADDGIAVHGYYSWVIESSGSTLIVSNTADFGAPNFQVGDTLRLVDANDVPADSAVVTGVTPLPSYTTTRTSSRQARENFMTGPYFQITLDRNVTAGFDYLADSPNESGSGFVLLDNTIRNNRARGIIVKGLNGTIEGNTIDGSTLDGIKVGPDFWWSEAGYVSGLTIKGNTINNIGYWAGGTAGILISPDQGPMPPAGAFQNISISGNTFSNFDVPAIFLTSASGVTIDDNIFTSLETGTPFNPNYVGQDVLKGVLVYLTKSSSVQFAGNTVLAPGASSYFAEATQSSDVSGAAFVKPVASSATDFSGTQGAANWNYGYFPSGNVNGFTLLSSYDATSGRWQHVSYGPPWTSLWAYSVFLPNGADSGTEEWATRRWTSNFAGTATITGHLAKTDTSPNSTGIYGMIYVNHVQVYKQFIQGNDGTGVDYSVNVQLHNGDTVDFAVAPNGAEYDDGTQFTASILSVTLVSQTISFSALPNVALGTAAFALSATASSGYPVSFASNTPAVCSVTDTTVTIVASGGCSITASQAGDAAYAAASPATQKFTVFFADVASGDSDYAAINAMAQHGITAGCGNNDFCPNQNVTRDEMAIFIVRSIYGNDNFTYSTIPYFTDVTATTFGFKWIQKLKDLGITSGCTATTYCPTDVVARDQMAVFIIRARLGVSTAGPGPTFTYPTTPYFTDASTGSEFAFPWIQRMKLESITNGCTATTYCGTAPVTRGQMAIFLMRGAFNQFLPAGTPIISSISPSTLAVGASGTYTITGANTNFVQGTTQLSPIPGVTIGTVTVSSATSLTVQLTAASNAVAQPYSIMAITGSEQDLLPSGLVLQ